jgi:hypothetical protein
MAVREVHTGASFSIAVTLVAVIMPESGCPASRDQVPQKILHTVGHMLLEMPAARTSLHLWRASLHPG